jgi:hypothetical protein
MSANQVMQSATSILTVTICMLDAFVQIAVQAPRAQTVPASWATPV